MAIDTLKSIPTTLWNGGADLLSGGINLAQAGYTKYACPAASAFARNVGPAVHRIKDLVIVVFAAFAAFISNGYASGAAFCATYQAVLIPGAVGAVGALAAVFLIAAVAKFLADPSKAELGRIELEKQYAGLKETHDDYVEERKILQKNLDAAELTRDEALIARDAAENKREALQGELDAIRGAGAPVPGPEADAPAPAPAPAADANPPAPAADADANPPAPEGENV